MTVKITFPNGVTVTGTDYQVKEVAKAMGFSAFPSDKFHYSESKGMFVLIEGMDDYYLVNTIYKQLRDSIGKEIIGLTSKDAFKQSKSNAINSLVSCLESEEMKGLLREFKKRGF